MTPEPSIDVSVALHEERINALWKTVDKMGEDMTAIRRMTSQILVGVVIASIMLVANIGLYFVKIR